MGQKDEISAAQRREAGRTIIVVSAGTRPSGFDATAVQDLELSLGGMELCMEDNPTVR